jgi:hypothetical protein
LGSKTSGEIGRPGGCVLRSKAAKHGRMARNVADSLREYKVKWSTRSEAVSLLIQGSIMVMDTPLTTAQRRVLLH